MWQDELNSGRYQAPSKLTWAEFRKRCEAEKLSAMPESTQVAYRVALDHLQRIIDPDRLAKLTPQVMSRFQAEARKEGMKATTLARHLRHIKACLRWGERQGLMVKAPAIEMPKLAKGQSMAKHRPVTAEEFDRMLAAVPKVRPHDAPAWERLLRGLWLSGLRLAEAVALDWDDGPFVLDTTGKHPAFHIEAEGQKVRRSEMVPTTPDFAEWILAETPAAERVGKVFKLVDSTTGRPFAAHNTVGPVVSAIGRKAGVVVGTTEKLVEEGGKRVKRPVKLFAGAHDLRRAFCSPMGQEGHAGGPTAVGPACPHLDHDGLLRHVGRGRRGKRLMGQPRGNGRQSPAAGNTLGNTDPETTQGAGVAIALTPCSHRSTGGGT